MTGRQVAEACSAPVDLHLYQAPETDQGEVKVKPADPRSPKFKQAIQEITVLYEVIPLFNVYFTFM